MKQLFARVFAPVTAEAPPGRIVWADGVRGWAAVMVVLWHLIYCFLIPSTPQYDINAWRFLADGYQAVLIFFVLSGFALSIGPITRGNAGLPVSAASRYVRLMIPILGTSLIAYAFLRAGWMINVPAAATYTDHGHWLESFYRFEPSLLNAVRFSLYDVFFAYDSAQSYNSSLWTMPVELFGSFLVFGYLALFRRDGRMQPVVFAVLTAFLFVCKPLMACFLFGMLIAELTARYRVRPEHHRVVNACALAVIGVVALISTYWRPYGNDRAIALMAAAVVAAVALSPLLQRFFSNRVSHFLGAVSFPLYLIQIIVICSWSSYWFVTLPSYGLSHLACAHIVLGSSLIVCLLGAWALLPLERASMRWSKALVKRWIVPARLPADRP